MQLGWILGHNFHHRRGKVGRECTLDLLALLCLGSCALHGWHSVGEHHGHQRAGHRHHSVELGKEKIASGQVAHNQHSQQRQANRQLLNARQCHRQQAHNQRNQRTHVHRVGDDVIAMEDGVDGMRTDLHSRCLGGVGARKIGRGPNILQRRAGGADQHNLVSEGFRRMVANWNLVGRDVAVGFGRAAEINVEEAGAQRCHRLVRAGADGDIAGGTHLRGQRLAHISEGRHCRPGVVRLLVTLAHHKHWKAPHKAVCVSSEVCSRRQISSVFQNVNRLDIALDAGAA